MTLSPPETQQCKAADDTSSAMLVWDLPLRLFHWGLVVSVFVSVGSAKTGVMFVHEKSGLTILGLVIFRLIWGFIGSPTARFSHFIKGPSAVFAVLRALFHKQSDTASGHSALGGWAVLALLGITLYLPLTGMVSSDDILYEGPLAFLLPDMMRTMTEFHHYGEKLLFTLIALHLAAMAVYYLRLKKNLIPAMVTGRRRGATGISATVSRAHNFGGLLLLCLCIGGAHLLALLSL
jgi:cytochrome b